MTEYICGVCGEQVRVGSQFEIDCPECGADDALEAIDAYDPEPLELICTDCGYRARGRATSGQEDEDGSSGRYTVEDSCPRCEGVLDPDAGRHASPRDRSEYELARAAARKLMREHVLENLPVDVEALARAEGLEVIYGDFEHEGRLVGDRIEVPVRDAPAAQRFAIGHELGHWYLRHQVPESKLEGEANAFAAELLIPPAELRQAVDARTTLPKLCVRFGASRQAMLYALMRARLLDRIHPMR